MDKLGRYYTECTFSTLLINSVIHKNPKTIVDLGIGEGSLTKAAYKKWSSAQFYAIDIDKSKISKIKKKLPFVKITNASGFNSNPLQILKCSELADLAICNPPFLKIKNDNSFHKLFCDTNLDNCINLKTLTSDLIFFAQNLNILKSKGELAIILPDGLLTNSDFINFRKDIISNHTLKKIIQLPDNVFKKTEARTHILILKKGRSRHKNQVTVSKVNLEGVPINQIEIDPNLLIERMDFDYVEFITKIKTHTKTKLKDINPIIKRGKYNSKELANSKLSYFHSTSFKNFETYIKVKRNSSKLYEQYSANAGDILLCRVGKRIIGKCAILEEGRIIISDCILKITVEPKYRKILLESLLSKSGQIWLKTHAHGVCSQVISKKDLLNFPLFIDET